MNNLKTALAAAALLFAATGVVAAQQQNICGTSVQLSGTTSSGGFLLVRKTVMHPCDTQPQQPYVMSNADIAAKHATFADVPMKMKIATAVTEQYDRQRALRDLRAFAHVGGDWETLLLWGVPVKGWPVIEVVSDEYSTGDMMAVGWLASGAKKPAQNSVTMVGDKK